MHVLDGEMGLVVVGSASIVMLPLTHTLSGLCTTRLEDDWDEAVPPPSPLLFVVDGLVALCDMVLVLGWDTDAGGKGACCLGDGIDVPDDAVVVPAPPPPSFTATEPVAVEPPPFAEESLANGLVLMPPPVATVRGDRTNKISIGRAQGGRGGLYILQNDKRSSPH